MNNTGRGIAGELVTVDGRRPRRRDLCRFVTIGAELALCGE